MTNSNKGLLSRTECSALRGLAILGIVLHNYCHWLVPAVKENEYKFSSHNVDRLLYEFHNIGWDMPMHIFSFFGHYGVPVFLFLSAYGLTMKYEKNDSCGKFQVSGFKVSGGSKFQDAFDFLKKHFKKLFGMMILGFAAFMFIDNITENPHHYELIDVIAQLGLFNNLLQNPEKVIHPGPYWFFGLMMQLYIVYRLLMYKRHWGFTVTLIVICFLMQCFLEPKGDALNYLRYNCIGSILPFGLGLLYARYTPDISSKWVYLCVCIISLLLIYEGSMWYQTWYWVPVAVCSFTISLIKILPSVINSPLVWVGEISSAMFVCHPITRKVFIHISKDGDIYTGLLIYLVATLVLAIIFKKTSKLF